MSQHPTQLPLRAGLSAAAPLTAAPAPCTIPVAACAGIVFNLSVHTVFSRTAPTARIG